VAAGDGNFALVCAREGASVVASDLSPGMVERGRTRAQAEGYDIEWLEADAEALPFDDASFDCVGSVFGAMIAPRPRVMAEELFRVVRPGGTVGMTAWTTQGFTAELFALGRSYAPPSDQPLSDEWSVEDNVRERFDGLAARFDLERRELVWEAESPEALVAMLGTSAPPWVAAKQNLPPERWDSLVAEALEIAKRWGGDERPIKVENEYALIVARKRG
jgi:SAM-dependent methyltransferase